MARRTRARRPRSPRRWRRGAAGALMAAPLVAPLVLGLVVADGTLRRAGETRTWEFQLEDAAGRAVRSADFTRRHLLVTFGYTSCPDVCPATLAAVAETLDRLPADTRGALQAVFISVDPERDAGPRLKEYAALFHPGILGLTGPPEAVRRAADAYGVVYRKVGLGGGQRAYGVDHTSAVFLVGPVLSAGEPRRLELLLSSELAPAVMAERIAARIGTRRAED